MVKAAKAEAKLGRLDARAWIATALEALAEGGIDTVRVEPLAKRLAVTKGSFYWHFADRRALIEAMLTHWSEGRIAAIREQTATGAAGGESPTVILLRLADRYTRHGNTRGLAIELAIRAVDGERLAHVATLFGKLGWAEHDARARAVLFYSYLFGQSLLDSAIVTPDSIDIAIETLLAPPA